MEKLKAKKLSNVTFWNSKIKIRPCDKLFSEYIRKRDGDCKYRIRCHGNKLYTELQCSHYHSRRKESVRFDPENCDSSCAACHLYVTNNPEWLRTFKLNQLGQQRYDLLQWRAESPGKRDDELSKIVIKELLKEVDREIIPQK